MRFSDNHSNGPYGPFLLSSRNSGLPVVPREIAAFSVSLRAPLAIGLAVVTVIEGMRLLMLGANVEPFFVLIVPEHRVRLDSDRSSFQHHSVTRRI